MLLLGRKIGEDVVIRVPPSQTETVVFVAVTRISQTSALQQSVRLGFSAPQQVVIHRREVDSSEQAKQKEHP